MWRNSYPPLIILLDLLFVLLFMFLLINERKVDIVIPPNKLFDGGRVFHFDEKLNQYVDDNSQPYSEKNNIWPLPCGEQDKCIDARRKYGEKVVIVLPDDTFRKILEVTFFSIKAENAGCNNVKFIVSDNGRLSPETFDEKNNKCLAKIPGLKEHFKE